MSQQPSATITGQVLDAQGRPAAQARVYFISGPVPLQDIAMLTGTDGTFSLTVPAEGVYRIGVNADHCVPLTATAVAKAGQNIMLRLRLQPASA
jgi:hypothetical protein